MPIIEVTMYRAVCDQDGCGASPSDEYDAWGHAGDAVDTACDHDWYIAAKDGTCVLFCEDHLPRCACPGCPESLDGPCPVRLTDDEFGDLCEDCAEDAS